MGRPKFPFKNKLQVNPLDRQFPGIIGDILSRLRDLENTGQPNLGSRTRDTKISAGANKLVKIQAPRNDAGTLSYQKNTVHLSGWDYRFGNDTTNMDKVVTFGLTFDEAPIVIVNFAGALGGGAPTTIDDLTGSNTQAYVYCNNITTTGFTAKYNRYNDGSAPGNYSSANTFGFTWMAIGKIT